MKILYLNITTELPCMWHTAECVTPQASGSTRLHTFLRFTECSPQASSHVRLSVTESQHKVVFMCLLQRQSNNLLFLITFSCLLMNNNVPLTQTECQCFDFYDIFCTYYHILLETYKHSGIYFCFRLCLSASKSL